MSLGEGHLTRIPARKLCPGVALACRGYTIPIQPLGHPDGRVAGAGLELDTVAPWQGAEVVVTSNADINARGCAWIAIAMSHCHASRGGWGWAPLELLSGGSSLAGPCLSARCVSLCAMPSWLLVSHRAAPPGCNACLCSAGAMGCWHDTRPSQPRSQWCSSSPSEGACGWAVAGDSRRPRMCCPRLGPSWVVWWFRPCSTTGHRSRLDAR